MMDKRKNILTIFLILLVVLLGGVSIYLAIRVSTPQPIAPTAPVSQPKAFLPEETCTFNGGECTTTAVCASGSGTDIGVRDCTGSGISCCKYPYAACSAITFTIACVPRPSCLDTSAGCTNPPAANTEFCPFYSCDNGKAAYIGDKTTAAAAGDTVYPEQKIKYVIPFTNKAASDVASAKITDVLDSRVSYVSSDNTNCSYVAATRTVTCDIAAIQRASGAQSGQVSYIVNVLKTATVGDLLNTAKITTDKNSEALCTNKLAIKPTPRPVLSCIAKRSYDSTGTAITSFTAGQNIVYTLTLTNTGNAASTGYQISDLLSGGGRNFLSFVSGPGCNFDATTNKIICDAALNPDETKSISFTAKVSDTAPDTQVINNVANLVAPATALEGSIGTAQCATTAAVANPIINAVKKAYQNDAGNSAGSYTLSQEISSVSRSQIFVYTINVQNSGTGKATGVTVTDVLNGSGQTNLTYVDSQSGCTFADGTKTLTCTTDVDPASSSNVSFRVQVNDTVANATIIKNVATVKLGNQTKIVNKDLTVSSVVSCNQTCNSDSQCGTGLWCDVSVNKCRNKTCTAITNCECPVVTTPTPTMPPQPTTIVVVVTPTEVPTQIVTQQPTIIQTPVPTQIAATATPATLPSTGILDVPGVAVFGGGLMMAVVGILLAL